MVLGNQLMHVLGTARVYFLVKESIFGNIIFVMQLKHKLLKIATNIDSLDREGFFCKVMMLHYF